jgi:molecular chaperone GrpE
MTTERMMEEDPSKDQETAGEEGRDEGEPEAGFEAEPDRAETPAPEAIDKDSEIAQLKDKLLRSYAEIENYKKRAAKDRADWVKYANEGLLKEFLAVVDSLIRAKTQGEGSPELAQWVDGVALIIKQLEDILSRFGVQPVEALEKPFDPSVHQAMAQVESDREPGMVVEEVQKGYKLYDRVLRPSLVTVAKNRD